MQKRTLYSSLLLASFLLVFTFSFGSAQTVTFESKNVPRCSDVILNITVNTTQPLSAFEIVFTNGGDFTGTPTVNWDINFNYLHDRVLQNPVPGNPNTVRMAAMELLTTRRLRIQARACRCGPTATAGRTTAMTSPPPWRWTPAAT